MAAEGEKSRLQDNGVGPVKDPLQNPLSSGTDDEEDIIAIIRPPEQSSNPDGSVHSSKESSKVEDEPDVKDLFVIVDDFQKHVFTIDTYITYRVFTRTTRSAFDEPEYSVRRRYQDFLWLRHKLLETEETHIIPPLPEKHSMRLDRLSREFAVTRQAALHKFMQRVSEHPVVSFNEFLKVFLTAKELTSHRKASAGIVSRIGSTIKTTTSALMLKNRSPEFTIMMEYTNMFGDKMSSIDRIAQRIVKEQAELATEFESYGPTYRLWGNSETELSDMLIGLADCLDKCATAHQKMTESTEVTFLPAIKEYFLYADAVKATLKKRDFVQMEYELACEELTKKKNEREHLQKQVDYLSDRTEVANADIKADMERWHRNKKKDMKGMFVGVSEGQMECYQQCLDAWEKVIAILKGNAQKHPEEISNSSFQTDESAAQQSSDGDVAQKAREKEDKTD